MAQLVIAAAGAYIGSAAITGTVLGMTGVQIGWMAGSLIGAALAPTQKSQGPRLGDLRVQGTEYGAPIPWVAGSPRISGQVIWSSPRRETANTEEVGKGGGAEYTTYTYDVDLLILLTENQIINISRVWRNGELVYSAGNAKENVWANITIYTGSATQLPDPTYEAAVGSANAPAYRGRGYVAITGLQLGSSGVIPNLTFEVSTSVPQYWISSLGNSENNQALTITTDASNNVYIGGKTKSSGDQYDSILISKYNSIGLVQWQKTLNILEYNSVLHSIAVDSLGDVYATGVSSFQNSNSELFLVKYNSSGAILWQRILSGGSFDGSIGYGAVVDSVNNVYVVGVVFSGGSTKSDIVIVKYNSSGTIQWQRTLTGTYSGQGHGGICVDSADNIYILGSTDFDALGNSYVFTAKYNSSGTIQWQRTLGGSLPDYGEGGIAVDTSNNIYVVGNTSSQGLDENNILLAKYNSSGVIQWQKTLSSASGEGGLGVSIDSQNNIYVSGFTYSTVPGSTDGVIAKYNSSGVIQWQRTLGGSLSESLYGIKIDGLGNLYVAGYTGSAGQGGDEILVAKLPSDGTLTGTYGPFVYAASSFADASSTLTDAAGTLTDGASTLTSSSGALVSAVSYLNSNLTIISQFEPKSENVFDNLLLRAGYSNEDYDTSTLTAIAKPVRGMAISQISNTRSPMEMLQSVFFFEASKSDKIYIFPRRTTAVASIPYDDLGTSGDVNGEQEPLALNIGNELEVPAQISLSYNNVSADYNIGTEHSDRLLSSQTSSSQIQMPLGMTPAEAKGVVDAMLWDSIAGLTKTTISLPLKYAYLEPGDIVNVTDQDAKQYRLRILSKRDTLPVLTFECTLDDVNALTSAEITDNNYISASNVGVIAPTIWQAMDIPILRDADNEPGYYIAVAPDRANASDEWKGAAVARSWDDVVYEQLVQTSDICIMGDCVTVLGDWTGGNVFDETNTLTVIMQGQLSSSTRADMLLDLTINAMLVGDEIIRFRTATLISSTSDGEYEYRLSGLVRGQRGTEWAIATHSNDERCVLLNTKLRRIITQTSQINIERYIKAVTFNKLLSSIAGEQFTDTGIALKPFSPANPRALADGNDLVLTWQRRTRLSYRYGGDTPSVPLGEALEAYRVKVYDGSTLVRTANVLTATWTYDAADITADGFSTGASINFEVMQLSETIGEGYTATFEGIAP